MALSRGLLAAVGLGLAARLALMAPVLDDPPSDPDNYLPIARSLADGEGFRFKDRPTAYRPPLYPLVLAPIVATLGDRGTLAGVLGLHLALGAGTIALTHRAATRWGLSPARSLAAAGIVALDPVLVTQARSVMTETLAAFLVALALAALAGRSRAAPILGGIACGLAALCRPSLLPGAGLIAAAALRPPPEGWGSRGRRAAGIAAATAIVLVPWGLRNLAALGEPVLTTTHGGYTLYLANNPVYYREVLDGPPGAVWSGADQEAWFRRINREAAGLPEPVADRYFQRQAARFIAGHPADFARASAARLGRFWGVAPAAAVYPTPLRLASAAWTVPLWLVAILGLLRAEAWRWPRVAAPAAAMALTLVHAAYWTDMRMRAPIVPAVALVAASAGAMRGASKK